MLPVQFWFNKSYEQCLTEQLDEAVLTEEAYSSSPSEEIPFILQQPMFITVFTATEHFTTSWARLIQLHVLLAYFFKTGIMEIYFCPPANYPNRFVWFSPMSTPVLNSFARGLFMASKINIDPHICARVNKASE
jgi:hypothetical protein